MKTGKSLSQLAAELERQADAKKDYLADTRRLKMEPTSNEGAAAVILQGVNGGMTLRPTAHAQMAATLQIPKPYYDRMLTDAPDLLSANVNRWLERQPAKRLIRTMDNSVRAILSDSYRPLDNLELAQAVLPKLIGLGARVESCEVTESKLYLKVVTPAIEGSVKVGDLIQAGAVVSNSEIGHGSLSVAEMDFRLACLNGMIRAHAIRKAHLGRSTRGLDALEDAREFFKTATREADDRAFFLKVQDTMGAMFDRDRFQTRILEYSKAAAKIVEGNPAEVVEVLAKRFAFNEGERGGIMRHLIEGGDLSTWGFANAVTRAAQDVESYDRSTELEAIGGDIIELPPNAWRVASALPVMAGASV